MHWLKNPKTREETIKKISKKLKGRVSPRKGSTLTRVVKRKISLSKKGIPNYKKRLKLNEKQVCKDYVEGKSTCILAKENNTNAGLISRVLKRNNIKIRNNKEKSLNAIKQGRSSNSELQRQKASDNWSGKKNHRWKTIGSKRLSYGYVFVKIAEGYWEKEHWVVIEKMIGRKLYRDEVVHHINGNKADNRPENLKVMTDSEHKKLHAKLHKFNNK